MNQVKNLEGAALFADAIERARAIMYRAPWVKLSDDPSQEKAAADSQLKHQICAALDQGFVTHDPLHPEFRLLDQHNQFGLVNPDNRYYFCTIATPGTYEIHGKRGNSADLQIQVGGGNPGFDPDETSPQPVSQMSLKDLKLNDDNTFKITISEKRTGRNWLTNTCDGVTANSVLIRECFLDWENETSSTWYIERVDTRGTTPSLTDREKVNQQYQRAADYLVGSTKGWVKFVTKIRLKLRPNQLIEARKTEAGLPGQWNSAGVVDIEPDKAIIVTVPAAPARYQSIQVGDQWFNSFDFCRHQTSLTAKQATPSEDGQFRFVISQEDPGIANWLDPVTATKAFIFIRWQGLPRRYEFKKQPSLEFVDFADLYKHFPDESLMSLAERKTELAKRQRAAFSKPRGF